MIDAKFAPHAHTESCIEKEQLNLEDLQREVTQLLEEISTLVSSTRNNLSADGSEKKYEQFQQQIREASQNVAGLQLRMAIAAPMKAGKSTIINAIIGEELLPSCAAAMTTIPTEIVFNANLSEPQLICSEDFLYYIQDIYIVIKQQIQLMGMESIQAKIARYPHLRELLAEIDNTEDVPFSKQIIGREKINQALNRLNHLIRLSTVIDPFIDPLSQLTEIPRLETPFLGSIEGEQTKTLGNLVIIDTPGPNEAGENLKLTAVVEEQLRRSSIVLIVLDFTQLNNEAAEAIKRQVRPVIESIGKENLYVLVNKVDQRRKGDMTPEQVQQFVLADLELSQADDLSRVFEVSAIRAFAATKFLRELEGHPEQKPSQMSAAETLAREVYGIDWEEELEEVSAEILVKKARKLWQKSGFAPFLRQAIAALMASAAPRSLISALNLSRRRLLELKDDLNLHHQAISQDAEKLQTEIKALETDLAYLESCRTRLTEIDKIKSELQQKLETILTELQQAARVSVEDYFVEEDYERGNLFIKADIKTRELLLTNIGDFNLFPKWLSENIKSSLEYKTAGIAAFKTERDAADFAEKIIVWAKQRAETLLFKVRQNTEIEIETAQIDLAEFLIKETQPIIERARTRLQEKFEIELILPPPALQPDDNLAVKWQLVKTKTRLVDQGYEERLVQKRAWYYWFGLIPFYRQETYKKPYKKDNYYTVSLHDLVKQINTYIENSIEQIKQKITNYLDKDLQEQVNIFFAGLDEYLGNYRDSLKQVQASQQLSLEQQEKLASNLSHLIPQTTKYLEKTDKYLQLIEQFLK